MSRTRHPAPPAHAAADPADHAALADPGDPAGPAAQGEPVAQPGLSRRERRAAARGASTAKIAGPAGVRRVPVPDRQRNFATRRRG